MIRERHLRQIINDEHILVAGEEHTARAYYGIPSQEYAFSLPVAPASRDILVGHILPLRLQTIIEYFHA
jgi:hypothetical protein